MTRAWNVSTVAARLGISRERVYALIREGKLKVLPWCGPGKFLFSPAAVRRLIEAEQPEPVTAA